MEGVALGGEPAAFAETEGAVAGAACVVAVPDESTVGATRCVGVDCAWAEFAIAVNATIRPIGINSKGDFIASPVCLVTHFIVT